MKKLMMLTAVITALIAMMTGCENTYVTSAKVYIQQQQYDKAIEMCETAISQTPSNPDAYFVLGKAYSLKGDYRSMNEAFKKSLEISLLHEKDIDYYRGQAYQSLFKGAYDLSNNKKYDESIDKYELATEILPKRSEAYVNLAVTYSMADNDSMAIETYKRAIAEMPDSLTFVMKLGLTYYNQGRYEPASEAFNTVVEKADPSSQMYFESLFSLANSYAMMKQEDKALEIYQQTLSKDPENTMILYNMARMFLLQGEYEKAIDVFKQLLEKQPDDFDANYTIGNAYLQINNKLIDEFNQVRDKLNETEAKQHRDAMQVNFQKALPYFEKAVELNPEHSSAWFSLGTVYVRLGETKKGEEAYAKSDSLKALGK